ncbi:MAG: RHS repeat-associated core domain-containing protein [Chloroflexota bacterium]|nr:RHS repeat-associated core domain-containing protein [Chloroflexota bacterium]
MTRSISPLYPLALYSSPVYLNETYPPTSGNTGKPPASPVAPFNTMSQLPHCYEINLTTGEETSHYYLGGREIAYRNNSGFTFVHQDHLSGTSTTTDSTGMVASTIKYFPYGDTRSSTGSLGTDRQFTGQRLDGSGLYYYNARYYDPAIGRFISADTVVLDWTNPQTWNAYSYCYNNPLAFIDPSGHSAFPLVALGFAIFAYAALSIYVAAPDNSTNGLAENLNEVFRNACEGIGTIVSDVSDTVFVNENDPIPTEEQTHSEGMDTCHADPTTLTTPVTSWAPPSVLWAAGSRLSPDPSAKGPHTTFEWDQNTGRVTSYAEWTPNPQNPSGFDLVNRVDIQGKADFNKVTGEYVPTPHAHDPTAPGGVRPVEPWEVVP